MLIYKGGHHNGGCYSTIAVIFVLWIIIYCLVPEKNPRLDTVDNVEMVRKMYDMSEKQIKGKIDTPSVNHYYHMIRNHYPWGIVKVMAMKEDSLRIRALKAEYNSLREFELPNKLCSPYHSFEDVWVSKKTLK